MCYFFIKEHDLREQEAGKMVLSQGRRETWVLISLNFLAMHMGDLQYVSFQYQHETLGHRQGVLGAGKKRPLGSSLRERDIPGSRNEGKGSEARQKI